MRHFFFLLLLSLPSMAAAGSAELQAVPFVDVARYTGTWYQIAANPRDYEKDCFCTRQRLDLLADGTLGVYNSCRMGSIKGDLNEIRGIGSSLDPVSNAIFSVDFGRVKLGQYWIIALDQEYKWAVVSEPTKKALFILARKPQMSEQDYSLAIKAVDSQVSTKALEQTGQIGCKYP